MFACLELIQSENKGILKKLFNILTMPRVEQSVAHACDVEFLMIQVYGAEKGEWWNQVEQAAGRFASRMLLPEGCVPPPDSIVDKMRCPAYEREILLRTACMLIDRTRMPLYRRFLGLYDPDGRYMDFALPLLKHYSGLHVVTQQAGAYARMGERVMEELGAPLQISSQPDALSEAVLLLVPEPERLPEGFVPHCTVLTGGYFNPGAGWDVISSLRLKPDIPPEEIPHGIEPDALAGALHEFGGLRLRDYTAQTMLYNGRSVNLSQASAELLFKAGYGRKLCE